VPQSAKAANLVGARAVVLGRAEQPGHQGPAADAEHVADRHDQRQHR
jgi:hypothetical protein